MKTTRLFSVAGLLVSMVVPVYSQVNIVPGAVYTENFDGLGAASSTWVDEYLLPGWYTAVSNTAAPGVVEPYTVAYTASSGTASGSSTTLYSLGSPGAADRALGGQPVSTRYGLLAWRLANASQETITNLVLTYDGEEWRSGVVNSSISVSYKVFASGQGSLSSLEGWSPAPASLTFIPPTSLSTATALDGNNPTNRVAGLSGRIADLALQPGQELWLKWTLIKVAGGNLIIGIDNVSVAVPKGQPPVIGAIPDVTLKVSSTSATNTFTVSDAEDDAKPVALPTPIATSSDETIIPAANVYFGGSGPNRTAYVVSGAAAGSATITVTVTDSDNNVGQQTFGVTVLPENLPPAIAAPAWTNTLVNVPVAVPFAVSDGESPANSLTVTGWVAEYSATILQSVEIKSAPDGTNRIITVTPVAGMDGVGVVTLSVADADYTNTHSFAVAILPANGSVLSEHFDYPVNTSILNSSPGYWTRRNSTAQSINFRTAQTEPKAWIRPRSGADDAAVPLLNRPYVPGEGAVLYTLLKAQWIDVGDVPPIGDSSGAFLLLAPGPTATADQLMQVGTTTNGLPDGSFRLQLSNGEGAYTNYPHANLVLGTEYRLLLRYDVDTATSTLWIDAASEASPSVTAVDAQSPVDVGYLAFRQEPGMGNILVDDLVMLAVQKPTVSAIASAAPGGFDLYFPGNTGDTAASFEVERATAVSGPYSTVASAIVPAGTNQFKATVPGSGEQSFFRVKRKPMVF